MNIRLQDGRVFEGTALQIVQSMRSIAFCPQTFTICEYANWIASQVGEEDLSVTGETDDEVAASLVSELLRIEFAQKG